MGGVRVERRTLRCALGPAVLGGQRSLAAF